MRVLVSSILTFLDADAFYKDRRNDAALEARDGTTEFGECIKHD